MGRATLRGQISKTLDAAAQSLEGIRCALQFVEAAVKTSRGPTSTSVSSMQAPLIAAEKSLPRYLAHGAGTPPDGTRLHSFVTGMLFISAVTEVESAIAGTCRATLAAFPQRLSKQSIEFGSTLVGTKRDVLNRVIDAELLKQFYGKPADYWKYLTDLVGLSRPEFDDWRDAFCEAKATRDLGAHNDWRWNPIYSEKAGRLARQPFGAMQDDPGWLHPSEGYVDGFLQRMTEFVTTLRIHCESKYAKHGKGTVFQEMWEQSSLEKVVPFAQAWQLVNTDLIRPKPGFSWRWSTSEGMLFGFFERIYYGKVIDGADAWVDRLQARLTRSDMQIVSDWLDGPFSF